MKGCDLMLDFKEIQREMDAKSISDREAAEVLSIYLSTWYRRKSAPNKFQIGEVVILKDLLNLSTERASQIFLA